MDQLSQVRFFARALLNVNLYFLRQLPAEFKVQLGRDEFLRSITTLIDNKRVSTGNWPLGPGFAPLSSDPSADTSIEVVENVAQDSMRADAILQWNTYFTRTASHIPYAVVKNKTSATLFNLVPDNDDDEDLVEGGTKQMKSKKTKKTKAAATVPETTTPCSCGRKATRKRVVDMTGPRPKQVIGVCSNVDIASQTNDTYP